MKKFSTVSKRIGVAAAAAAMALVPLAAGPASAASQTGWVGPAGTTGYLHTSTIVNAPTLYAESKIYHSFGVSAAPGTIGVRPRLFKSGALCQAIDYQYNVFSEPEWSLRTSATCGTGSYNSHGFVAVWNESSSTFNEYVTFPSNPLNWTAPAAARTASPQITEADRKGGVNAKGQKFGSADTGTDKPADVDLVLAIGTNGTVGYVRADDLDRPAAANPTAAKAKAKASRNIPLLKSDGVTKIGTFTVSA